VLVVILVQVVVHIDDVTTITTAVAVTGTRKKTMTMLQKNIDDVITITTAAVVEVERMLVTVTMMPKYIGINIENAEIVIVKNAETIVGIGMIERETIEIETVVEKIRTPSVVATIRSDQIKLYIISSWSNKLYDTTW
jgi:hypothetical protein